MKQNFQSSKIKPLAPIHRILSAILVVMMAVPNVVLADSIARLQIAIVSTGGTSPAGGGSSASAPSSIQLQLEGGVSNSTYCLQSSTNLLNWKTILAVKPLSSETLSLGSFSTTNSTKFFRLGPPPPNGDTNPPAWSNGVQAQFTIIPPNHLVVSWTAASDDVGVAEYRLYVNGVLLTNILGTTLSYDFTLNSRQRADLGIQAVDASGNATGILTLVYLPGDKLLAVSDDSGRVYTSYVQSNGNFSPFLQLANFGGAIRGLCLGDFDRDGLTDLVAGYPSGNTLVPFFYNGSSPLAKSGITALAFISCGWDGAWAGAA